MLWIYHNSKFIKRDFAYFKILLNLLETIKNMVFSDNNIFLWCDENFCDEVICSDKLEEMKPFILIAREVNVISVFFFISFASEGFQADKLSTKKTRKENIIIYIPILLLKKVGVFLLATKIVQSLEGCKGSHRLIRFNLCPHLVLFLYFICTIPYSFLVFF